MAEQLVDEVISDKAFEQVERMVRNLTELAQQVAGFAQQTRSAGDGKNLADYAANSAKAADGQKKLTEATEDYITYSIQAQEALKMFGGTIAQNSRQLLTQKLQIGQINDQLKAHKKAFDDGVISQAQYLDRTEKLNIELTSLKVSSADLQRTIKNQSREMVAAAGSVEQLRARLLQFQQQYDALSLDVRQGNVGKMLKDEINAMTIAVNAAEQGTQRFGRNVGNYSSVAAGFNQILSETPNIAQGFGLWLRSIANNVTFLSQAVQEQIAQGKSWKDVLRDLRTSFLSFNGAITIAITILTLIPALLKANTSATEEYSEALKSSSSDFSDAAVKLNALRDQYNAIGTTMEQKKSILDEVNRSWGDQVGHMENVNELDKFFVERAPAFLKVLELRAKGTAALSLATKLFQENLVNQTKLGDGILTWYEKAGAAISGFFKYGVGEAGIAQQEIAKLGKVTEENNRQIEAYTKSYRELFLEADKISKQNNFNFDPKKKEKKEKEPKDLSSTIIQAQIRINDALRVLNGEALQMEADRIKAEVDNEDNGLQQRLTALEQYFNRKQALLDIDRDAELKKLALQYKDDIEAISKSNATKADKQKAYTFLKEAYDQQRLAISAKYNIKQEELDLEHGKTRVNIIKQTNAKVLAAQAELVDGRLAMLNDISEEIAEQYNKELSALLNQLQQGRISWEAYEKEKHSLQLKYNSLSLDSTIAFLQNEIDLLKAQGIDVAKLEEALTNFKKRKYKEDQEAHEDSLRKKAERERQYKDAVVNLYNEAFAAINQIKQNELDKEIELLERRKEEIDYNKEQEIRSIQIGTNEKAIEIEKNRDNEIEAILASGATEEEKDQRIKLAYVKAQEEKGKAVTEAEKKAAAEKRALEIQQQQLQIRKAKYERQARLSEIMITTALNVVKAFPNFVLMALAAALGGVQYATAASAPIPQYAEGTNFHPGGPAIVGDGGEPELIRERGREYWSGSSPEVRNLARGATVTPLSDIVTSQMGMLSPQLIGSLMQQQQDKGIQIALDKHTDKIVSAIQNKQENNWFFKNGELKQVVKKGNQRTTYLGKNIFD